MESEIRNQKSEILRTGCLCVVFCVVFVIFSQAQDRTRILFVLDGSLSMKNSWKGGTKWDLASKVVKEVADSLSKLPNVEMGMRVFGHLYPEPDKNCYDTKLEVKIDSGNAQAIKKKLLEIRPKGITPLVYSIEKCVNDFGTEPGKNVLIIITDGEDACNRDPCSVMATLQKHNILSRPFIIGMELQSATMGEMNCMGKLLNTNSAEEFAKTVKDVVEQSVAKTSLQINLNDKDGKPSETDVNMTFYDMETGLSTYNFYHSLNARGLPDTLIISPDVKYKLQIHTIPPVTIENVVLKQNTHTVIEIPAPQGYLNFTLQGTISKSAAIERIKCLVHLRDSTHTTHVQRMYSKEKYLAGTYDLEILTLPRTFIKGVQIDQSKTTDVLVPSPGLITINKSFEAYGGIFVVEGGKMKKIYDLHLKERQETIALQPGKYRIVYRSKNARTIHTTVDKEFEVTSGGSLSLKL